jgi:hypothetical protein
MRLLTLCRLLFHRRPRSDEPPEQRAEAQSGAPRFVTGIVDVPAAVRRHSNR